MIQDIFWNQGLFQSILYQRSPFVSMRSNTFQIPSAQDTPSKLFMHPSWNREPMLRGPKQRVEQLQLELLARWQRLKSVWACHIYIVSNPRMREHTKVHQPLKISLNSWKLLLCMANFWNSYRNKAWYTKSWSSHFYNSGSRILPIHWKSKWSRSAKLSLVDFAS